MDTGQNHARFVLRRPFGRAKNGISIYDTTSHGLGVSAGEGAAARLRGSSGSGALSDDVDHARYGDPEVGKRSASAPRVRLRCQCMLGNYACECQTATRGNSFKYLTTRYVVRWYYIGPDSDIDNK
eukprot:659675-Pleurochrysis_carterae.AAC.1